jgi:hypothetical protein
MYVGVLAYSWYRQEKEKISMPRLTNKEYIKRHRFLRSLWLDLRGQQFYAELDMGQQQNLHAYYKPHKEWTERELMAHRNKVDAKYPKLPQAAGRSFADIFGVTLRAMRSFNLAVNPDNLDSFIKIIPRLDGLIMKRMAQMPEQPYRKNTGFRILPQLRPNPDVELLARAFIAVAERLNGRERGCEAA